MGGRYNRMVTHLEQTVFREYEQQGTGVEAEAKGSWLPSGVEAVGGRGRVGGGAARWGSYSDYTKWRQQAGRGGAGGSAGSGERSIG